MLSVPFYNFPSSPILIIGAIGIALAIVVFYFLSKILQFTLQQRTSTKEKKLLREKEELNQRLLKIEQDLKNLSN